MNFCYRLLFSKLMIIPIFVLSQPYLESLDLHVSIHELSNYQFYEIVWDITDTVLVQLAPYPPKNEHVSNETQPYETHHTVFGTIDIEAKVDCSNLILKI